MVQGKSHRKAFPRLAKIGSQSTKNSEWSLPDKGVNGSKKINGRKHHIVVDTMGLLMSVVVTTENVRGSTTTEVVVRGMKELFPQPRKTLADDGHADKRLVKLARKYLKAGFEVVTRNAGA